MSEVKTYDLEDTGSAYQQYREMVVQTEYEGDWVCIEDYKKIESENKRLKSVIEYIKDENRDGLNDDEDFRVMVMRHIGDLENDQS